MRTRTRTRRRRRRRTPSESQQGYTVHTHAVKCLSVFVRVRTQLAVMSEHARRPVEAMRRSQGAITTQPLSKEQKSTRARTPGAGSRTPHLAVRIDLGGGEGGDGVEEQARSLLEVTDRQQIRGLIHLEPIPAVR
eukprot:406995-Rhodomonas_salina.5